MSFTVLTPSEFKLDAFYLLLSEEQLKVWIQGFKSKALF